MRSIFFLLVLTAWPSVANAQTPWLPEAHQAYFRSLMPAGVPMGDSARFYRLPQVYQSIYFLNGHEQRDILPVTTQQHPWTVSGGMHWAKRTDWRNVTALEIPAGKKIEWWEEYADAGAPGPVAKIRWRFPVGTLAYDVLIRTGKTPERVFEVRIHERLENGWDHGTTYRPAVEPSGDKRTHTWQFVNEIVAGGFPRQSVVNGRASWTMVDPIRHDVAFVPTRKLVHDGGHLIPHGYVGAGASCNSCHVLVGHRTGYGTAIRGDDGRFSWHPLTPSGRIDGRWPIVQRHFAKRG